MPQPDLLPRHPSQEKQETKSSGLKKQPGTNGEGSSAGLSARICCRLVLPRNALSLWAAPALPQRRAVPEGQTGPERGEQPRGCASGRRKRAELGRSRQPPGAAGRPDRGQRAGRPGTNPPPCPGSVPLQRYRRLPAGRPREADRSPAPLLTALRGGDAAQPPRRALPLPPDGPPGCSAAPRAPCRRGGNHTARSPAAPRIAEGWL